MDGADTGGIQRQPSWDQNGVMSKPARSRTKACEHCKEVSSTLYRVAHGASASWVLICNACRLKVASQASYRYGGTWKADKRH